MDIERTLALLALTAFHDVMKVEALLPRVLEDHHDFCGFKAGDVINDHDIALGYVLEHFSDTLPSFVALPAHQQKSVRFTQAKMGFNHGWLVQAEAPPSALFGKFKQVILKDTVVAADVAFYFVHWLTDLAGAEPSPLEGSEKVPRTFLDRTMSRGLCLLGPHTHTVPPPAAAARARLRSLCSSSRWWCSPPSSSPFR